MIRMLWIGVAFAFGLTGSDLDDGKRAYDNGDFATALRKWSLLADQGNGQALCLVGSMFFDGKGVKQDKQAAATFFRFAADAGSAESELRLATMYMTGDGVRKDADNSLYWNRRAAEHGFPLAQLGMGWRSWAGQTGAQDRVQAYMWFSLCSASDNACTKARNVLVREMTQGQIDEAKQRTKDWKAKHNGREDDAPPKGK